MSYATDRDQTVIVLTGAGFTLAEIEELFRLAATAERLNEINCNQGLSPAQEKRVPTEPTQRPRRSRSGTGARCA